MPTKKPTFPWFRSVTARMEERYIFNFRIRPDDLRKKLPVPWLEPQVVNGWSVVSYCILWLKKLSIAPIPPLLPFETLSSAYRIGVVDTSGDAPEPSVYVTERWADLPLIARLAPWILLDTIPLIRAAVGHAGGRTHTQMSYVDGTHLFSAEVEPTGGVFESELFDSLDGFARFIKDGVSSYASSIYPDVYSKVDLDKAEVAYEPLRAQIEYSELHQIWPDVEMPLDSAVRAKGARYKWTYRGLHRA